MKYRGHMAVAISVITGILAFDWIWNASKMMVEDVMATSLFLALAAGLGFLFWTFYEEERAERKEEETSRFVQLDNGLNVMIQRSRSGRKSA